MRKLARIDLHEASLYDIIKDYEEDEQASSVHFIGYKTPVLILWNN